MPRPPLADLLAAVAADPPALRDHPTADDLVPWRDRIDALDRAIVRLLNERSVCANHIGHIKKSLGVPVYVPSREGAVLQNVVDHNAGPLPDTAVRRVFERVIDETRSLERQRYQDDLPPTDE